MQSVHMSPRISSIVSTLLSCWLINGIYLEPVCVGFVQMLENSVEINSENLNDGSLYLLEEQESVFVVNETVPENPQHFVHPESGQLIWNCTGFLG